MILLCDSSFLFGWYDSADSWHPQAEQLTDNYDLLVAQWLIPWPILHEVLNTRRGPMNVFESRAHQMSCDDHFVYPRIPRGWLVASFLFGLPVVVGTFAFLFGWNMLGESHGEAISLSQSASDFAVFLVGTLGAHPGLPTDLLPA